MRGLEEERVLRRRRRRGQRRGTLIENHSMDQVVLSIIWFLNIAFG